jgi:hypothetical protein
LLVWLAGACGPEAASGGGAAGGAAAEGGESVDAVLDGALQALGSRAALEGIFAIELHGVRQEYLVAAAQDPETPPVFTATFREQRDVRGGRALRTFEGWLPMRPQPIEFTQYLDDGLTPGEALEEIRLSPERLVLAAASAPERRLAADSVTETGRRLHVVAWGDPGLRLLVDAATSLPAGWTGVRRYADDPHWAVWGDVRTRVAWSNWSADSTGLRYPFTINVWHDGRRIRTISYTGVDWDADFPADSFADVSARREGFASQLDPSLGNGSPEFTEHVGGIVQIGGIYDVTLVRQDDGVVVIEAPHSSGYSRSILEEVERRWPGASVKAVVAASFVWPHVAGVRTYAARGIPIYASPRTARTIRGMTAAPHRLSPDELSERTGRIDVREVADSVRIGNLVVHRAPQPGGEHGRAALIVTFDDLPFAYLGDFYVPERFEPNFWRESLAEGLAALDAVGSRADTILSLHNEPAARDSLRRKVGLRDDR